MKVELLNSSVELWQVLTAIGLVLSIFEIFTPTFILLPIAIALFISAPLSTVISSWYVLLTVMALVLVVNYYLFSKLSKNMSSKSELKTNADALINQQCSVTKAIKSDVPGEVKVYSEKWTALSKEGRDYKVGDIVRISSINGNKLIVSDKEN